MRKHSECYGVSKFRCILAFIGNLTGVQRYRRLDGSLHNQTSKVYNQALTLSGDVPDQSQRRTAGSIDSSLNNIRSPLPAL